MVPRKHAYSTPLCLSLKISAPPAADVYGTMTNNSVAIKAGGVRETAFVNQAAAQAVVPLSSLKLHLRCSTLTRLRR